MAAAATLLLLLLLLLVVEVLGVRCLRLDCLLLWCGVEVDVRERDAPGHARSDPHRQTHTHVEGGETETRHARRERGRSRPTRPPRCARTDLLLHPLLIVRHLLGVRLVLVDGGHAGGGGGSLHLGVLRCSSVLRCSGVLLVLL